ncbi:hypothetical protein [Weissella minor]|nr:hypothetical protein [Weissella minor]
MTYWQPTPARYQLALTYLRHQISFGQHQISFGQHHFLQYKAN